MIIQRFMLSVAIGASLAGSAAAAVAPSHAMAAQVPFPPPTGSIGTFADGSRFKVVKNQLYIVNGTSSTLAKPGSYKLTNDAGTLVIVGQGKFSAATLSKFPALGHAELNPQPLPP